MSGFEYTVDGLELILGALVGIVAIVAVFTPIIILTVAFLKRSGRRGLAREEEIRLIQDIHSGLERMEHRIQNLETLVFDKERRARR